MGRKQNCSRERSVLGFELVPFLLFHCISGKLMFSINALKVWFTYLKIHLVHVETIQ